MGMIRIVEKSKHQKRKPGWKQAAAEYQQWLSSVSQMTSGIRAPKVKVKPKPAQAAEPLERPAARFVLDDGTRQVPRPERQYQNEMLQRELAARERKFNSAPAYNKGGSQFVSEEELKSVLSTNRRRP